jgi:membrane protein DedA with SNARE-associated domain
LFVARFMVGIRAPVYLAAGVLRMPLRRFLLTDALCATTVVSVFFGLSYYFGDRIKVWIHDGEFGLTIAVVLAIVAVLFFTWRKGKKMIGEFSNESAQAGGDPSANGSSHHDSKSQPKSLAS